MNENDKKLVSLLIEKTEDDKLKWVALEVCNNNQQTITSYSLTVNEEVFKLSRIVTAPIFYTTNSNSSSTISYELEQYHGSNYNVSTHNISGKENEQLAELYKLVAAKVANLQGVMSSLESL